jgi:hypothetical protein
MLGLACPLLRTNVRSCEDCAIWVWCRHTAWPLVAKGERAVCNVFMQPISGYSCQCHFVVAPWLNVGSCNFFILQIVMVLAFEAVYTKMCWFDANIQLLLPLEVKNQVKHLPLDANLPVCTVWSVLYCTEQAWSLAFSNFVLTSWAGICLLTFLFSAL